MMQSSFFWIVIVLTVLHIQDSATSGNQKFEKHHPKHHHRKHRHLDKSIGIFATTEKYKSPEDSKSLAVYTEEKDLGPKDYTMKPDIFQKSLIEPFNKESENERLSNYKNLYTINSENFNTYTKNDSMMLKNSSNFSELYLKFKLNQKLNSENNSGHEKDNNGRKRSTSDMMMNDYPSKWTDNVIKLDEQKKEHIVSPNKKSFQPSENAIQRSDKGDKYHKTANLPRWSLPHSVSKYQRHSLNNSLVNVTAQVGGDTFLPCKVGHLGDRQISWIRSRDWHVLSSGNTLFTPDSRVSVLHEPGTQDWTLHIRYVTPRDNGTYECQVSTGTGIISLFTNLTVVTPIARIPGRGRYHVNEGSPINLSCLIRRSPIPPRYVFWYHNGKKLNFMRHKSKVTINLQIVEPEGELFRRGISAISRLRISSASDSNSGNYTCDAPMTSPASTTVFVSEGEKTAAVHRNENSQARSLVFSAQLINYIMLIHSFLLNC